jgi:hypothetical protein
MGNAQTCFPLSQAREWGAGQKTCEPRQQKQEHQTERHSGRAAGLQGGQSDNRFVQTGLWDLHEEQVKCQVERERAKVEEGGEEAP